MTKESLLIVDAQPRRRRLLEVGLRRAGYRVTVAGEPDQASWFLERSLPDVIVSSFSFERVTGLDFARRLRERPEWAQVGLIFVVSNHAEESEASPWADTMIREPVFLRDVVRWVEHVLWRRQIAALARGSRRSVGGDLTRVAAADLFGLVERMAATGTLEVDVPGRPATVWFRDGQVLDAVFGSFEAEDAVFRLLGVESGSFEFALKPVTHAGVISTQTGALVMEGLRRLDEWARLCDELPPLSAVLRVNHEVLGHRRGELSAEQLLLLQRCDGRRSIEAVVDQSGQDSLLALEVLQNLLSLGVLVTGTEQPVVEAPLVELPPLPQPFPAFAEGGAAETELVSGIPEEAPGDAGVDESPTDDGLPRGYVFRAPLRPVIAARAAAPVGAKVADALALAATERAAVEAALATGRVEAPRVERARELGTSSAERDAVDRALAGARALLQARLRREEERDAESRPDGEPGPARGARIAEGEEVR
ncbi:MAG TPA: response regulator, partial [Nannocystaceae bacterium]|nr:response regulator [Nannocystaceae bacterium]